MKEGHNAEGPEVVQTLVTKNAVILFPPNFQIFLSEKTKCLFVLKAPIFFEFSKNAMQSS